MCELLALILLIFIFGTMRSKSDSNIMHILSYTTVLTMAYLLTFNWEYVGLMLVFALVYDGLSHYFRFYK